MIGGVAAIAIAPSLATAATFATWTDWTSSTATQAFGSVQVAGRPVDISYTGSVLRQTQTNGTFGWGTGGCCGLLVLGEDLLELPDGDNSVSDARFDDIIATLGGAGVTHTFRFSDRIRVPIYINFFSVGSIGFSPIPFRLNFGETDFSVLASNVTRLLGAEFREEISGSNHALVAREGSGTIQLNAGLEEFSFVTNGSENWWGFTVGVQAEAVPEPTTMAGLAIASGGTILIRHRQRRQTKS